MNRIYRLVWNHALHAWQVASELAHLPQGPGVSDGARWLGRHRALALACAVALGTGVIPMAHAQTTGTTGASGSNATATASATNGAAGNAALTLTSASGAVNNSNTLTGGAGGAGGNVPGSFSGNSGNGGDGGAGVSGSGFTLINSGTVVGGTGGIGGYGGATTGNSGAGGSGVYVSSGSTATTISNNSGATIAGGSGGQGQYSGSVGPAGNAGNGGAGINGSNFALTNNGIIAGGSGGQGGYGYGINGKSAPATSTGGAGGNGGVGVSGAGFTITNTGAIIGGVGGAGGDAWWATTDNSESDVGHGGVGGTGGAGVSGSNFILTNAGTITGGAGGNGENGGGNGLWSTSQSGISIGGAGGNGGTGISGSDFTLTNTGMITGGTGGAGGAGLTAGSLFSASGLPPLNGAAGAGGAGVSGTDFTLNNNTGGTIAGGIGGSGNLNDLGSRYANTVGNGGVGVTGSGFTLTNNGSITGGGSAGSYADGSASNGGAGVSGADFTLNNNGGGAVSGGSGGIGHSAGTFAGGGSYVSGVGTGGGTGGNGGAGVSGSGFTLTNRDIVAGGLGGAGGWGYGAVSSGSGGSGGTGVYVGSGSTTTITNNSGAVITGGNGGQGGLGHTGYYNPNASNSKVPAGNGGTGGVGGVGVSLVAGATLNNQGNISGGIGGAGGAGSAGGSATGGSYSTTPADPGNGGNGGAGGVGVTGSDFTLINSGTITGGNGGSAGVGGTSATGGTNGTHGTAGLSGGVGVVASGHATIINSGRISGSLFGDGQTQADAVDLSGGGNALTLQAGYRFTGNVVSTSGTTGGGDALLLGGSANAGFDVSQIAAARPTAYTGTTQFYGFTTYEKTGSSTWSLTGAYATPVNWVIEQGALDLSGTTGGMAIDSLSGAGGSLDLGTNTLTLVTSASSTFAGAVSGQRLTLQGSGTQILDGHAIFATSTTIAGGTLEIGDSESPSATLISPQVFVQHDGMLRGHGAVTGNIVNGGIVWPGGSVGVLTVNGNYTQNAAGILTLDVTPTQASELKVAGQASLAGTLNLVYAPGTYAEHTYTLVQADALTGRFATTTATGAAPAALIPDLVYSPTAVYLALTTVHPADGALYGNLQRAANLANQQTLGTVLDAALWPAENAADGSVVLPSNVVRDARQPGLWVQSSGSNLSLDGSPGLDGTGFGMLGGFDAVVTGSLHVGMEAGVNQLNTHDALGGNGRIQSAHAGLYAFAHAGPLVISATVDGQHQSDRIDRTTGIGQATSSPAGRAVTGGLQVAWPLQARGWQLTPKIGALYQHQAINAFNETVMSDNPAASAYGVTGARSTYNALQPYALVALAHAFQAQGIRYVPQIEIGYRHDMRDEVPTVMATAADGTVFALPGTAIGRGIATVGARLTAEAGHNWSLSLDYQGQFARHLHDNALSIGFTKQF